jgi:membrane-associated protease RseP (regulator of RpoE activity)
MQRDAIVKSVAAVVAGVVVGCAAGYALGLHEMRPLDEVPLLAPVSGYAVAAWSSGDVLGVKVFGVQAGSALAEGGLQNGDLVTGVDGRPLRTVADAHRALAALRGDVVIHVKRGDDIELDLPCRQCFSSVVDKKDP